MAKEDDRYLKANGIDPSDVKATKGPPGTKLSSRNNVGSKWDKRP